MDGTQKARILALSLETRKCDKQKMCRRTKRARSSVMGLLQMTLTIVNDLSREATPATLLDLNDH